MNIEQYGIILNVEKYDECVSFYKNLFGLTETYSKIEGDFKLTCLDMGGTYLLIETGGIANTSEKTMSQNSTKLRFNVEDLPAALIEVQKYFKNAQINEYDWGSTINIHDPDGNRIGIRNRATTNS